MRTIGETHLISTKVLSRETAFCSRILPRVSVRLAYSRLCLFHMEKAKSLVWRNTGTAEGILLSYWFFLTFVDVAKFPTFVDVGKNWNALERPCTKMVVAKGMLSQMWTGVGMCTGAKPWLEWCICSILWLSKRKLLDYSQSPPICHTLPDSIVVCQIINFLCFSWHNLDGYPSLTCSGEMRQDT